MKILLIHSEGFSYEVLEKARGVKPEKIDQKFFDLKEKVLVVFTSIEETDQTNPEETLSRAVEEISVLADDLKEKNIVLYPWAHLSDHLASPKFAQDILQQLTSALRSSGYNVHKAAFGWYKAFRLNCLGHNRAENFRTIKTSKSQQIEVEEHPSSYFCIYTPRDQLIKLTFTKTKVKGKETVKVITDQPFPLESYRDLRTFIGYEMKKERHETSEPPHLAYMRRHELASADPSSDPGNLRWYPRGRILRRLIEAFAYQKTASFGAVPIETPIMYNLEIPAVREQVSRFPARQYKVFSGDKQLFLRYASDFGMFFMISNVHLSYRNLPLRVYELTKYAFRRERRGEVVGLRRLRAFTMPDLHTFCSDQNTAKEEFALQYDLCLECIKAFEVPFEIAFRTTKTFFEENRLWIQKMVEKVGKPILLELFDDRYFYWILKFEFNVVDAVGKAAALSTVQIDVETAKRYNISFQDADGQRKYPVVLHNSPTGAVERVIYAILERA
ncbi:MAG: threonine--tRNA ligase, partial [Candidatus Ranarchaeia archaeon]